MTTATHLKFLQHPLKDDLQAKLATIKFGAPDSCTDQLDSMLQQSFHLWLLPARILFWPTRSKAYSRLDRKPGDVRKTWTTLSTL